MAPETRADVILTFDNLGEAADEELGLPVDPPPHYSVVDVLPRILGLLERAGLQATFFVEAINVGRYPGAIAAIAEAGHEIGCHAWRHERWHGLEATERCDVLRRSLAALRSTGRDIAGFRPPGGLLEDADFGMLAGEGVSWVSPAGARAGTRDGVVSLPFAWRDIDAYYFASALDPLRRADGLTGEPLPAAKFARAAAALLDASLESVAGEPLSLVLHPFLYTSGERVAVLTELIGHLGRIQAAGTARVGPGRQAAERARPRLEQVAPELDRSTWATA